jgi:low affinity Fe/Cu permease
MSHEWEIAPLLGFGLLRQGSAGRGKRAQGRTPPCGDCCRAAVCGLPADLGRAPGMIDPTRTSQHHPVVVAHSQHRAANTQLRIADAITAFAGSMPFVYLHAIVFAAWMLFVESDPWPKLTLIVSLEAIFLSTFVMIGQNRQAAFQQAKADHDFVEQEQELRTNTELTRAIHTLTLELHRRLITDADQR